MKIKITAMVNNSLRSWIVDKGILRIEGCLSFYSLGIKVSILFDQVETIELY